MEAKYPRRPRTRPRSPGRAASTRIGARRAGVLEFETGGVQEHAVEGVFLLEVPVGGRVAVARIAHHRVADSGRAAAVAAWAGGLPGGHFQQRMTPGRCEALVARLVPERALLVARALRQDDVQLTRSDPRSAASKGAEGAGLLGPNRQPAGLLDRSPQQTLLGSKGDRDRVARLLDDANVVVFVERSWLAADRRAPGAPPTRPGRSAGIMSTGWIRSVR